MVVPTTLLSAHERRKTKLHTEDAAFNFFCASFLVRNETPRFYAPPLSCEGTDFVRLARRVAQSRAGNGGERRVNRAAHTRYTVRDANDISSLSGASTSGAEMYTSPLLRGAKRKRTFSHREDQSNFDVQVSASAKGDLEISDHCPDGKYVIVKNKGTKVGKRRPLLPSKAP